MYNEILLIELIRDKTGYEVAYAPDQTIDLIGVNATDNPKVYVGHIGIKLQHPEYLWSNGYNELENPEILLTHIQFICRRDEFAEVRTAIAEAYRGFTPFPNDSNYSSMVFIEANVVAKTSSKLWISEVVGIIFPRFS